MQHIVINSGATFIVCDIFIATDTVDIYNDITIIVKRQLYFNSSPFSAAYMGQWIESTLVQIMACHLFGAKPLYQCWIIIHRTLRPNFCEFLIKIKTFHFGKCIWKHRLGDGGLFVKGRLVNSHPYYHWWCYFINAVIIFIFYIHQHLWYRSESSLPSSSSSLPSSSSPSSSSSSSSSTSWRHGHKITTVLETFLFF